MRHQSVRVRFVAATEKPVASTAVLRPIRRANDAFRVTDAQRAELDERLRTAEEETRQELLRTGASFGLLQMARDELAAFDQRKEARLSGRGDRVSRTPAIRRMMKAILPPFGVHASFERLVLTRPLRARMSLAISFDDVHQWAWGSASRCSWG